MCAVCNTWAFLQLQGAVRTVLQGTPWVSFKSTAFSELSEGRTMLWLCQSHSMLSSVPSSWSQANNLISWKPEKNMFSLVKHAIDSPTSWSLDSHLCVLIQGDCHWDLQTKASQPAEPAPLQLTTFPSPSALHHGFCFYSPRTRTAGSPGYMSVGGLLRKWSLSQPVCKMKVSTSSPQRCKKIHSLCKSKPDVKVFAR